MKKILTIFAVFSMMFIIGCTSDDTKSSNEDLGTQDNETKIEEEAQVAEYKKISPSEAKDLMDENTIVLDVRTEQEYNEGYILGALLLPLANIQDQDFGPLEDKDQRILVYCRSGNRSRQASNLLLEAGYTNVYDFGGIMDWPYDIQN